jgi:nucleotide-binding universal stress UspA family protein
MREAAVINKILVPLEGSKLTEADLIAMSIHGRWVYGSVPERVLRDATCPVLLIRVRRDE